MEHDEYLLEGRLEECGIFPEFLAFEEPIGVLIPNEVIEKIACFSEAVVVEELLELFVGFVEVMANPIFAIVVDGELLVALRILVDEVLNKA